MACSDIDYSILPSTCHEWVYALTAKDCRTIKCLHPGFLQFVEGMVTDAGWLRSPRPGLATPLQYARWHMALDLKVKMPWDGTGWTPQEIREQWESDDAADAAAIDAAREHAECGKNSGLYFIGAEEGPIKIGISRNVASRLRQLQTSHPHSLQVHAIVPHAGLSEEADYHARFAEHRLHGEWFTRAPEIIAEIERLQS